MLDGKPGLPRSVRGVMCPERARGRKAACLVLLVVLLACAGRHASAQDAAQEQEPTRAAEAEAARRAKAESLAEAAPPGKVERAFGFIEGKRLFSRIFNPPRGWFAQPRNLLRGAHWRFLASVTRLLSLGRADLGSDLTRRSTLDEYLHTRRVPAAARDTLRMAERRKHAGCIATVSPAA